MQPQMRLVSTYLIEMFKECQRQQMKPKELREAKVTVTLVFKKEDEDLIREISGYTGRVVKGLKVIDNHLDEGVHKDVYIKGIKIEK